MGALLAAVAHATEYLIGGVAAIFLIGSLDELVMLVLYLIWGLWRAVIFRHRHRPLTGTLLAADREQPAAIMVPAWDESAVIGDMLRTALARLDYTNYRIFVGVYPNDAATRREVHRVATDDGRVRPVVLDHDGPTNKADCLNTIYRAIGAHEARTGTRFQIFVMDDAEDFVPIPELRIFNHLIPRYDVVQLAVFPSRPHNWANVTAGHYLDEFAQLHLKEMPVREWLTGAVPSAGVGCAFSRRALEMALELRAEGPFSEDSLTEDYELPLRLAARGVHGIFVKDPVATRAGDAPPPLRSAGVREYFPDHFAAAVRQKSRWIVGIALQGWRLGWYGGLAMRYTLFRDRKALAMNLASVLGYGLVFLVLAQWLAAGLALDRWTTPAVVTPGSWVDVLVRINGIFALVYLVQRAAFSWAVYGPFQAFLSIPRAVWGNIINFAASLRAIKLFVQAWRRHQRRIAWDKTQHAAMPRAKDAAMAERTP